MTFIHEVHISLNEATGRVVLQDFVAYKLVFKSSVTVRKRFEAKAKSPNKYLKGLSNDIL